MTDPKPELVFDGKLYRFEHECNMWCGNGFHADLIHFSVDPVTFDYMTREEVIARLEAGLFRNSSWPAGTEFRHAHEAQPLDRDGFAAWLRTVGFTEEEAQLQVVDKAYLAPILVRFPA